MSDIQNAATDAEAPPSDRASSSENARKVPMLQAKGSCWYCDRPLDNIKRFCGAACRDSYFDEEWTTGTPGA